MKIENKNRKHFSQIKQPLRYRNQRHIPNDYRIMYCSSLHTFGGLRRVYIIVFKDKINVLSLYSLDLLCPSAPGYVDVYPGSLKKGFSFRIRACIETNTCSMVDFSGIQFSLLLPCQVPKRLRQTFPQLYKFGFSLRPPEW